MRAELLQNAIFTNKYLKLTISKQKQIRDANMKNSIFRLDLEIAPQPAPV